jgi:hypothetical protein
MGATDSRLERIADIDRQLAASAQGYTATDAQGALTLI